MSTDPALLGVFSPPPLKLYRATITIGGANVGDLLWVDPTDSWIALAIEQTWLVPVEDEP